MKKARNARFEKREMQNIVCLVCRGLIHQAHLLAYVFRRGLIYQIHVGM